MVYQILNYCQSCDFRKRNFVERFVIVTRKTLVRSALKTTCNEDLSAGPSQPTRTITPSPMVVKLRGKLKNEK